MNNCFVFSFCLIVLYFIISRNFLTTLKFVDEGIKEMERIITDYYGDDGKTTFLMTSDHGMTDWGNIIYNCRCIYLELNLNYSVIEMII